MCGELKKKKKKGIEKKIIIEFCCLLILWQLVELIENRKCSEGQYELLKLQAITDHCITRVIKICIIILHNADSFSIDFETKIVFSSQRSIQKRNVSMPST